jgi:AhpD family alkylhydroperoxidase
MATKFIRRREELLTGFRKLRSEMPQVMAGFGQIHKASMSEGELSTKTKELIALAIGVTSRCEGCIALHTYDALRAGATQTEVQEALGVAIMMGGGPAAVYASEALEAVEQFHLHRDDDATDG